MRASRAMLLAVVALWAFTGAFGCPTIRLIGRGIKTTQGRALSLQFKIKNSDPAAYSNYTFTISIPQGLTHQTSMATAGVTKANIPPTVTNGVLLWRFPKLQAGARIKVMTAFQVDKHCVQDGMLAFDVSGLFQAADGSVDCITDQRPSVVVKNSDYCLPLEGANALGIVQLASGGMDCVESGTVAPLSSPSMNDCYQYCSRSSASVPWYFRMRTLSSGDAECSCVGNACHVVMSSIGPLPGRELTHERSLQQSGTPSDTRVYRVELPAAITTAQPTITPTTTRRLPSIEEGARDPMLNIRQLSLGYDSFLGLLPHEQQGEYMRNPIFKLHLDPHASFTHLHGQSAAPLQFVAPLEYFITALNGICYYNTSATYDTTVYDTQNLRSVTRKHGMGAAPIKVSRGVLPKKDAQDKDEGKSAPAKAATWTATFPPLRNSKDEGTYVPYSMGNSRESRESYAYSGMGYNSKTQIYVKRPYYTAGLRLDRFVPESFTEEFKAAALILANKTYDLEEAVRFIHTWGDHVFDSVEMGAMAYVTNYYDSTISKTQAQRLAQKKHNDNIDYVLFSVKSESETKDDSGELDGRTFTFKRSAITSIGEYSSTFAAAKEDCRIGNSIIPQIIGFNLRPLWDEQIPLDLFMSLDHVATFRNYLANATQTLLDRAGTCLHESGTPCKDLNGTCVTNLGAQQNGFYNFTCILPPSPVVDETAQETYDFLVYMIKGGGQTDVSATLSRAGISDKWAPSWTVQDIYDVRTLTVDKNFPVTLEGPEEYIRYKIDDGFPGKHDKTLYLSIVVCPMIKTPASRAGKIAGDTCFRIYWGCFRQITYRSANDDGNVYYTVEFEVSKHNRSPRNAAFYPGKGGQVMDPTKYKFARGGNATIYEDWRYPVANLTQALEYSAFPYGYRPFGNYDDRCASGSSVI